MQHETTHSRRRILRNPVLCAVLLLGVAVTCFTPQRASADAPPPAIQAASTTVMVVTQWVGNRIMVSHGLLQPAPEPAPGGFVSEDLVDTVSGLINDGVRLGSRRGRGAFFVHCASRGFGGVVSIRYRR